MQTAPISLEKTVRVMQRRCVELLKNRHTVDYAIVEPSLRDGDIVLYDYYDDDDNNSNIQSCRAPIKDVLLRASLLGHLCSVLPWNACTTDVSDARDECTSTTTTTLNEIEIGEMRMDRSWKTWHHATLVVIVRDETKESNPNNLPTKMLPYVFVPGTRNRLALIPLRTLLRQSGSVCFGVRHLLISEDEMTLANPESGSSVLPPVLSSVSMPKSLSSSVRQQRSLSTSTRSFIHSNILALYIEITKQLQTTDDVAMQQEAQVVQILLTQPAPIASDNQTPNAHVIRSATVTGSHEFLAQSLMPNNIDERRTTLSSTKLPPLNEILPLMHVSPAYLALLALYASRVTTLLPRAWHGAAHMCDSGLIDRFVAPAYSYSDETTVRF